MNWKFRTRFYEHTGVSLKEHSQITQSEETPVCLRIQLSRATVKDLHRRLQHAYQCADVRLVRRTTMLIDLLVPHMPVAVLGERWGLSPACIYGWQQAMLLRGLDSLVSPPWRRAPTEAAPRAEETLGRADRGWAAGGGLGERVLELGLH